MKAESLKTWKIFGRPLNYAIAIGFLASCTTPHPDLAVISIQDESSKIFSITKGKTKSETDRILGKYKSAQFALTKFPKSFFYFREGTKSSISVVVLFDENDLVYSDVENYIISMGGNQRSIVKSDIAGG